MFFVLDKGQATDDLVRLRLEICERYIREPRYRVVQVSDPKRDSATTSYTQGVEHWHEQRALLFARLIDNELADGECGAFLLWGEPGLYDSTLRILDRVRANGCTDFDYQVIPGISSVQALAARHRIPLNDIGQPIRITTGRRLTAQDLDNVVVMLDAHCAFEAFVDENVDIYWGAYIGTANEILIAGKLSEVCEQIKGARSAARARMGWNRIDDYLANADSTISLFVQIETVAAVANIAEIAAVDGIDGLFIGPSDLAASMGLLGQQDHPDVIAAVEHCIRTTAALGTPVGVNAFAPALAERYLAAGASFVLVGADVALLARGSEALAQTYITDRAVSGAASALEPDQAPRASY